MREINFLSNSKSNGKEEGDERKGKDLPEVKWTNPEPGKLPDNTIRDKSEPVRNKMESFKEGKDKSRFKKSRQEVLTMIKEEKRKQHREEDNKIKSKKLNLFGWLSKLLKITSRSGPPKSKGLKEKEILVDYQEVFKKEKDKRKDKPEFTAPAAQTTESKEAKAGKTGKIGDIVKEKLTNLSPDKWRAPKILKTNLIKGEVTAFFDWKKNLKVLVINVLITCLIIALIYTGLIIWGMKTGQQMELLSGEIEEIKWGIIKLENDIAIVDIFQKKLRIASLLLNKHIYWTNFFKLLEENTLADVYYVGGFSGNIGGKYTLPARADSFSTITDQIKVMRLNEKVVKVNVSAGSLITSGNIEDEVKGGAVDFQLELSVNPNIFTK